MKDLGDFGSWLEKLSSNMEKECEEAMERTIEEQKQKCLSNMEMPTEARNMSQFVAYSQSYKTSVEKEGDTIKGTLYSDLLVGGDDPKWKDVPVGAFLEWGTGELGFNTNSYPHGYDYTLEIWDRHTWLQQMQTGTFGIRARPHLIPSFNEIKPVFKENIRKAVKTAWMKSGK